MALAISNIPVLTGEVAEEFVRRAEEAERNRGCIDFPVNTRNVRRLSGRIGFVWLS